MTHFNEVLNTFEAAEYLKLAPKTIRSLARARKLPVRKVGKEWRFCKSALDRWLAGDDPPTANQAPLNIKEGDICPIYKRGGTYWIDFRHRGQRIRQSAGTESLDEAQELHDRLKADLWRTPRLGSKQRRTWKEAVLRWLNENSEKQSLAQDKVRLRILDQWLASIYVDEINRDLDDKIKFERAKQKKVRNPSQAVSPSEVNRMLALLRSILRSAADWEWIDRAPKVKLFTESQRRVRWLTHDEADRLLSELPSHLKAMARFTLATGLRECNVTLLEWSQVDMSRRTAWIHGDQFKTKKSLAVPLNGEALDVLREERFKHADRVFTYKGNGVARCNNHAWRKALGRAGIEDFRCHDLRHTWASWHVQGGTDLHTLQQLGGWKSLAMVQRYAHLAPDNLAEAAANSLNGGHKMDTNKKSEDPRL